MADVNFVILIAIWLTLIVCMFVLLMLPTLAMWFPRLSRFAVDSDRRLAQFGVGAGLFMLGFSVASLSADDVQWGSMLVSASVAFIGWSRLRRLGEPANVDQSGVRNE